MIIYSLVIEHTKAVWRTKIHTFRIFCRRNLDSAIQLSMGFRIPWPVFQILSPIGFTIPLAIIVQILRSTSKHFLDYEIRICSHEATQPWEQNWYKKTYSEMTGICALCSVDYNPSAFHISSNCAKGVSLLLKKNIL